MTTYNHLTLIAYDASGARVRNAHLRTATQIKIRSIFPGGLYAMCSFYVPRDIAKDWSLRAPMKIQVKNGFTVVWEGRLTNPGLELQATSQGQPVVCLGLWADVLMLRRLRKPWADSRLEVWTYDETRNAADKCDFDKNNRLQFTPKSEQWPKGHSASAVYPIPTGQTVKRVTFDYAFSETAQVSPAAVVTYNGATYNDQAEVCDGDPSTADGITLTTAGYIYIGKRELDYFNYLKLDLGPVFNANAATLTAEYSAGISDAGSTTWTALTITDGTAVAGKPFAQDGSITFTKPAGWGEGKVDGSTMYWLRLKTSANLSAVTFNEIYTCQQQVWRMGLAGDAGTAWSATTDGLGAVNYTFPTPTANLYAYFDNNGTTPQTPPADGMIYGRITNVCVYTETGAISGTEIVKDVRALAAELSADESLIDSNALEIIPFVSEFETYADILTRAAGYGDASFNPWYAQVLSSADGSDGKPPLAYKPVPTLTDWEYAIRLDERNLVPPFSLEPDVNAVENWIIVSYTDAAGVQHWVTPDDDAALKDTTSIADYGERHSNVLRIDTTSAALAKQYARRYLAQHKDPQWITAGPLRVRGYMRGKGNQHIPACEIMAGGRVIIQNFINSLDGRGPILLVTAAEYDDDTGVCALEFGRPMAIDPWLAQKIG
jgi:hypothetical protein